MGVSGVYRPAHPSLALSIAAGTFLSILTSVVLAYRIAVAAPSDVSGRVIHVFERYAPLVVINLIVLNILAPVIGASATLLVNMSFWRTYLTILGSLSATVLCWLFVLIIVGVVAVAAMRLVDRAARRWPRVARAVSIMDRAIIGAAAVYCVWGTVIILNGSFDRSSAVEHAGEIVRVWGSPRTGLRWADVRQAESNRVARVFVFPQPDGVNAASLEKGQHVRLRMHPGQFGISWIESMRLDFEHELPTLVAALPSASIPRKWLIDALLRDGRWTEAVRETQAYARYNPSDKAYVTRVLVALRAARPPQAAADVSRLIIPVSGTRAR